MSEELLTLALEDPSEARRRATELLAEDSDDLSRSYALQALGIVLRDDGRTDDALTELRRGLKAARASGSQRRERDVRATYGATLVFAGRSREGLVELDRALDGARGELAAKIRMRQAGALAVLGRYEDAAPVIRTALAEIKKRDDPGWTGRSLMWLAHVELSRGHLGPAASAADEAETFFQEAGLRSERLDAVEAHAEIAVARGDLARGLRLYGEVMTERRQAGLATPFPFIRLYASALLVAGLASDAVSVVEAYARAPRLHEASRAELDLLHAHALLASGDMDGSAAAASRAGASFQQQERSWHERRARLASVRARAALDLRSDLAEEVRSVAEELDREGAEEAPLALVLAGQLSAFDDRPDLWRRGALYRTHPNGLVRAAGWHARALLQADLGLRAGVLRAAASGLDAIDEHRRLMGSSELRALATTHGRELTTLALRHAAHDPRTLLRWSERTRATALAQPPATSDATTIPTSLAALRDNGRQLAEARQAGEPTDQLEKERLRLERAVRAVHHTLAPGSEEAQRPATAEEVVAGVGDGCLVELVDVDGVLHVLVVHNGRVRRRIAGTTAEVADLLGPTAMLMRRASRGRPSSTDDLARQLQEIALGEAVRLIPDGPVVLSPTARLHGVPWALLPVLADRPFSVVPSAGQWLRARSVRRPRARRTALVAGPGLASGGAEVPELAKRYPDAVLLDGRHAEVEATLKVIDGADLVHLAAHGRFRADSPLFSAIELADGPFVVHDLERLGRAPYRVVLSACESGVLAPVGAEEVLGLAAALISLGTSGLVCSVADVNDDATARLMVRLHDELAAGADPATALHATRQAMAGDSVAAATAAAFVALGS